ncbi:PE domain-containing protein [Nocardia sp. CA-107356]|uniref:PE domain-containing protein n=1 Tax=Nocardia sp. CA-107356 TaxID=3239972 RepID=UPI003D8CF0B6
MALTVDPAHLPAVSSQLDMIADAAIASLVTSAATCVVFPPAWDAVSVMVLPAVTAAYGESFFSCTGDGFVHREVASASLPPTAVAYSGSDIINGTGIASTGATLSELPG